MNEKPKKHKEYEPPQAVHLHDSDRAYGECGLNGSAAGYREYKWGGTCVTGHIATGGCHAGISPN